MTGKIRIVGQTVIRWTDFLLMQTLDIILIAREMRGKPLVMKSMKNKKHSKKLQRSYKSSQKAITNRKSYNEFPEISRNSQSVRVKEQEQLRASTTHSLKIIM